MHPSMSLFAFAGPDVGRAYDQLFSQEFQSLRHASSDGAVVRSSNIADTAYLAERKRPLLAIHFLKLLDKASGEVVAEPPITAWTIGFPDSRRVDQTVSYRVNTIWWQQNSGDIDEEVVEALDREE